MLKKYSKISKVTILIVIIFTLVISNMSVAFSSGNTWYDKYIALESVVGDYYYQDSTSNALAWGASYTLESYLDVYKLTENTTWLDKLTEHVDTMIGNATDPDGDGYLGWDTGRYAPGLILNKDFETRAGDLTMAANWTRWQSTSSTAYLCVHPNYTGTYSFAILTNGTSWQKIYQNLSGYLPGQKMEFSIVACKGANSTTGGQAYIYDATAGQILCSLNVNATTWTGYIAQFTAPTASGHQLQVWLGHQSYSVTGGQAYFDDIRISMAYPYIVHDGQACLPIAKFIKLVNSTPSLQTAYQTKCNTYQTFIQDEIVPRWQYSTYYGNSWVSSGTTEGYYKFPPNKDTYINNNPGDIVPYNMMLSFANLLRIMYDVNGNAEYLNKANRISTYFKNRLIPNGTAYDWNYIVTSTKPEDVSHGCIDMFNVLNNFNNGVIFSGTDIEKFVDTLTQKMWKSTYVYKYVDGVYNDGYGTDSSLSRILVNWIGLSQFDITVWPMAADQYRNYTATSTLDLQVLSQIMLWDPQRVVNQGFELKTSFDATQPARWNRGNGGTSTSACLDSTVKYEGNYGASIVSNGSTENKLYLSLKDRPSTATTYTCELYGKTDGSAAGGRAEVRNDTTGVVLGYVEFTSSSWTQYTFNFTTPANTTDAIRLYIKNKTPSLTSGKATFDNIRVKLSNDPF